MLPNDGSGLTERELAHDQPEPREDDHMGIVLLTADPHNATGDPSAARRAAFGPAGAGDLGRAPSTPAPRHPHRRCAAALADCPRTSPPLPATR